MKNEASDAMDAKLFAWLEQQGYREIRVMPDGSIAALMPLMYTVAIVHGINAWGYDDRWCYHSYEAAKAALDEWSGEGEPMGWHRHPGTGRRYDENGHMYVAY